MAEFYLDKHNKWVKRKYWRTKGGDTWAFMTPDGLALADHSKTVDFAIRLVQYPP